MFSVGLKVHSRADVRNLLLLDRELIEGRNQRVDLQSSFRRVDLGLGRRSSMDSNLDGAEAIVEVGDQVDRLRIGGGLKGKSKRKANGGETKVSMCREGLKIHSRRFGRGTVPPPCPRCVSLG